MGYRTYRLEDGMTRVLLKYLDGAAMTNGELADIESLQRMFQRELDSHTRIVRTNDEQLLVLLKYLRTSGRPVATMSAEELRQIDVIEDLINITITSAPDRQVEHGWIL